MIQVFRELMNSEYGIKANLKITNIQVFPISNTSIKDFTFQCYYDNNIIRC